MSTSTATHRHLRAYALSSTGRLHLQCLSQLPLLLNRLLCHVTPFAIPSLQFVSLYCAHRLMIYWSKPLAFLLYVHMIIYRPTHLFCDMQSYSHVRDFLICLNIENGFRKTKLMKSREKCRFEGLRLVPRSGPRSI